MIDLRERKFKHPAGKEPAPLASQFLPPFNRRRSGVGRWCGSIVLSLVLLVVGLLLPANSLRAVDAHNTLLILDASGSMWGRVEGRTKIETARDVIVELLDSSSTQQKLGLMSYGHRRKGDCSDIELLVTPAQNTNNEIQSAVKSIKPHGKTPLSASVIEAARTLRNKYVKSTVILVSDGRETCGYDPCQVASELEQAGIDFTAHVIGFNVTDPVDLSQLQCMAENTGGQFVAVANGAELSQALQSVSNVFDQIDGGLNGDAASVDNNGNVASSNTNALQGGDEGAQIYIEPLDRHAAAHQSPEILTRREVTGGNKPGGHSKSRVEVESIKRPAHGNDTSTGSDGSGDGAEQVIKQMQAGTDTGVVTELPASSVAVIAVPVELTVPPVLYTSQVFTARWTGSGDAGDLVTIALPDSPADVWVQAVAVASGRKLKLTAPDQPGEYEVRYVSAAREVLAAVAVTVRKAEATLIAPAEARSGRLVRIRWKGGTKDPKDSIVITRKDAPTSSAINRRVIRTETSVMLLMPSRPGEYELRYMQAGGNAIATQSIVVK